MIGGWYKGRARSKSYTPPRPTWTPEQRLEELARIAERAERGEATVVDELAAEAHMAALSRAADSHPQPIIRGSD